MPALEAFQDLFRGDPFCSERLLQVRGGHEKAPANGETISGNDQNQHASRLEPAVEVLEKYLFQPAVLGLAGFEVVGWIQIEQRQELHGAVHIQGIAMNDVGGDLAGLFAVRYRIGSLAVFQRSP